MKDEYISISEFAKKAKVSHQAIYKRLDKDLQPWLQVANGKKMLNVKALELFEKEKTATNSTKVATVELLQKTIDILEKELEEKDKQIGEKDHQIAQLHKLFDQEQQLRMVTERKFQLLEQQQGKEDKEGQELTEDKKWWQFWK